MNDTESLKIDAINGSATNRKPGICAYGMCQGDEIYIVQAVVNAQIGMGHSKQHIQSRRPVRAERMMIVARLSKFFLFMKFVPELLPNEWRQIFLDLAHSTGRPKTCLLNVWHALM